MRIIIVGCGNVGATLAEQLSAESHNVIVIDKNNNQLKKVTEKCDVMGVLGDGVSHAIQTEAGIEETDLLIAVTHSDEVNLLCCLIAKKAGGCHTIARVRNPIYNREISFIKEELGLSMVINPELQSAREISNLLRYPSAIEVDSFANGRVELLKLKLDQGNILVGIPLSRISSKLQCDVLICAVERDDQLIIPDGNFVLQTGDTISIVASLRNIRPFFKKMGLMIDRVKDAMIIGGGSTAYYLSRQLLAMGVHVKIIEKDAHRCDELCELLPHASIILGDGTDRNLLMEVGMADAEAFITMTDMDEENIMLSLYARKISHAKVVTRIHRMTFDELASNLDVGSVIYPRFITAESILSYVRAMSNTISSNVETLYRILDNRAEALEFWIREESPVVGHPLQELRLKPNLLIACIIHNGHVITPKGQDMIEVGDTVIVITTTTGLGDIKDILR